MTVMLLQRFSAPQSTLAQKKNQNSCDKDISSINHTTLQPQYKHNFENKYEEIQETLKNHQAILTSNNKASYHFNNIHNISNIHTNNNINNNNNNNIREGVEIFENSSKNEKFCHTISCIHNTTLTNISISNPNNNNHNTSNINNNNNNNNNNNSNYQKEEAEENELLTRDKQNVRQETITSRTTTITAGTTGTFGTSASQSRYYSQGVAMRYYRLWIYACNVVLLGSALGLAFALLRSLVFTRDPRRYLVPGVPRVLDPTALYAYLALATQLGLVQLLGCIAARRLSAKLLNAYWVLLLALLFGDAIIGVAWVFKFERIKTELRPTLKLKLQLDYGKDTKFSENWDRLQRDFSCCGVTGPSDYPARIFPETCCPIDMRYGHGQSVNNNDTIAGCHQPYLHGCEENLISWMRKTADLLFVIGFCVMAFSKLCFLGILRYEIREMIQKIQLLKDPPPPASATFIQSFCQAPQAAQSSMQTAVTSSCGLSIGTATATIAPTDTIGHSHMNYGGTRRTTLPIVVSSSIVNNNPSGFENNMPVLTQQFEQDYSGKHSLLFTNNLQQDAGADSDTNSHCALILEESTTTPPSIQRNYTTNSQHDKNNSNNNYEMREFNRRYLISNGGSPPAGIKIIPQNKRT